MKLLLAARLSTRDEDGNGGIGLDTQDAQTKATAERDGHTIVAVTRDEISGTRPLWERPNLRDWITDPGKLALYDGVIVHRVDRLTRGDDATVGEIKAWAHEHGKVILTEDGLRFPAEGIDGIRLDIALRMAHDEWLKIRERSMRALAELHVRGKFVGRPPFGYEVQGAKYDKRLIPTDKGRTLIPEIFARVIGGESERTIAEWLDGQETGQSWWPRTVGTMIRNPVYIGHRQDASGKTVHRCEALVDAGTFRRANDALSARPKRGHIDPARRAMLSGVLACPRCADSPMYRLATGYYRCTGRGRARMGCGNMVQAGAVDAAVDRIIREDFDGPVMQHAIIPGNEAEVAARLEAIRFEIGQLGAADLDDGEYDRKLAGLRAERDAVKAAEVVPGRVELTETDERYSEVWARTPVHERGPWLARHKFKVTASRDAGVTVAQGDHSTTASL